MFLSAITAAAGRAISRISSPRRRPASPASGATPRVSRDKRGCSWTAPGTATASSAGPDASRCRRCSGIRPIPTSTRARIRINSQIRHGIAQASDSEARDWLALFGSRPRPRGERMAEVAGPRRARRRRSKCSNSARSSPSSSTPSVRSSTGTCWPSAFRKACRAPAQGMAGLRRRAGELRRPRARARAMTLWLRPRRPAAGSGWKAGPTTIRSTVSRWRSGKAWAMPRAAASSTMSAKARRRIGSGARPTGRSMPCVVCYAAARNAESGCRRPSEAARKPPAWSCGANCRCAIRRNGKRAVEHFGFVDGVSQPIVRGTARANSGIAPMHLVGSGRVPVRLPRRARLLPARADDSAVARPTRHPAGAALQAIAPRRRNGRSTISAGTARSWWFGNSSNMSRRSRTTARLPRDGSEGTRSAEITPRWIAAKMVGRWPDGISLVRNPDRPPGPAAPTTTSPSAPKTRRASAARSARTYKAGEPARFARRRS